MRAVAVGARVGALTVVGGYTEVLYPILEAARANALLESGEVIGNVVLVSSELQERI